MKSGRWLESPVFQGDEKKTRLAYLANTLILYLGAALIVVIAVVIPVFAYQKTGSWIIAFAVFIALFVGRILIFRGRVALACVLIFAILYLCVLSLMVLSDGMSGTAMFYFATVVLVAGYFLEARLANAFTGTTFALIVAASILREKGFLAIPRVFDFNSVFSWFATALGLLFMARARTLFAGDLENVLSLTKAENAARRNAETNSAQKHEETELRNRQLAVLNQLGQTLSRLAPLPEILERISQLIGRVYDTSNLYIALYDETSDYISFPVYWIEGERKPNVASRPLGIGITEFVIRSRSSLNIPEMMEEVLEDLGIIPVGILCKCYLGVPIIMESRVLGVIALQDYKKSGTYDETHVEFLSTIAAQAAIAIENARMYEKLQRQLTERELAEQAVKKSEEEARQAADRLLMVNHIGLKITTDLEFEQLMQTVYEQCQAIAYSDSFYIAFYDQQASVLSYPFSYSDGTRVFRPITDMNDSPGIAKQITGRKETIYVPDVHCLPEGITPITISATPSQTRSYLGLPLVVGEQAIGILSMQNRQAEAYGHSQIKTLELVATQVSIAIKNSQLYERLKTTLEEREALIRELYHRTRNNMNLIIALLNMQAEGFADERLKATFAVAEHRIRSMAIVHEKLIESGDLSRINLSSYIGDLVAYLMRSYSVSPERVTFCSRMEDIHVSIETAMPCGLILNELISNSLKHAFPGDRVGTISVDFSGKPDTGIFLRVGDNGVGLPPGFDVRQHGNLGLRTIFLLGEEQLKAKVEFSSEQGLACELRFHDGL